MTEDEFQVRLRIYHRGRIALGPGKVALLEAIASKGSIRQAALDLGMSYKRAWELVRTMNCLFANPLVDASKGGESGGGACLTLEGEEVVRLYRMTVSEMQKSQADNLLTLKGLLIADGEEPKGNSR